ncbi:MAG: PDZ domain-containing protein, partial [Lachnospiraceae bacterium]|nr:PDZ domain-containing protein [Lachnospiraceae bacterium]
MKKNQKHIVSAVEPGSIAEEIGLEKGDELLKINNVEIKDILDYMFLVQDDELVLNIRTRQGEICDVEIEKDAYEDLGIVFENDFMDEYRSCRNKCIFCF